MSENQGNEDQVERTTETTTESVETPERPDPAEEKEVGQPEVVRETVTETEPADDSDSSDEE